MAEYLKEMVSRDGRTVVSHTPTETVILQARGYVEADNKTKAAPKSKVSPMSVPKSEDATP